MHRDKSISREQLKQRDREIGIAANISVDTRQLKALRTWIASLRTPHSDHESKQSAAAQSDYPGMQLSRMVTTTTVMMWLTGFFVGAGLARTVLHYTGEQPVNLISTLLVLVGLQLVSLLLLIFFWLGGMNRIADALSVFHPAKIILWLLNRIRPKEDMFTDSWQSAIGTTLRPMVVYLGQHFTVALNLGILVTMIYLISTRDIAFGWSTSLQLDNETMFSLLRGLAAPWSQLLPGATPTAELIDASRFYRLQSQLQNTNTQPEVLATWWTYLIIAVTVYGLIPRLLMLAVSSMKYDRSIINRIIASSESSQVLARMRSPLVTTASDHQQVAASGVAACRPVPARQTRTLLNCLVIGWAMDQNDDAFADKKSLKKAGISATASLTAGGHNTLQQDQHVIDSTKASNGIVVLTRSWEPPLAEFNDFLADLRISAGSNCPIIVMLVALPEESVTSDQLQIWEAALAVLQDGNLYLESIR